MITVKEAISQAMNTLNPTKEHTIEQERNRRRIDALNEKWDTICPPLYQETDVDLVDTKKQEAVFMWNPSDKKISGLRGRLELKKLGLPICDLGNFIILDGAVLLLMW